MIVRFLPTASNLWPHFARLQISFDRAAKMATYYLPTISVFTEETTTQLSDPNASLYLWVSTLDLGPCEYNIDSSSTVATRFHDSSDTINPSRYFL